MSTAPTTNSNQITKDVSSGQFTVITGESGKFDVTLTGHSTATMSDKYRLVYTDVNTISEAYSAKNSVFVKELAISDASLVGSTYTWTISEGLYDGEKLHLSLKDTTTGRAKTLADVSHVLINGGPIAPTSTYEPGMEFKSSTTGESDASLSINFKQALVGAGTDISKIHIIATNKTKMVVSELSFNLSSTQASTGIISDAGVITSAKDNAFEFAVAIEDQFGVQTPFKGTSIAATPHTVNGSVTRSSIGYATEFKEGQRIDLSWNAPAFAPFAITGYRVTMGKSPATGDTSYGDISAGVTTVDPSHVVFTTTGTGTSLSATGLENAAKYVAWVQAISVIDGVTKYGLLDTIAVADDKKSGIVIGAPTLGSGFMRAGSVKTGKDISSVDSHVSMDHTLTFSYQDVDACGNGSDITGYKLYMAPTSIYSKLTDTSHIDIAIPITADSNIEVMDISKSAYHVLDASGQMKTQVLQDLSHGVEYTFAVAPESAKFLGARSATLKATPSTLPKTQEFHTTVGALVGSSSDEITSGDHKLTVSLNTTDTSLSLSEAFGGLVLTDIKATVTPEASPDASRVLDASSADVSSGQQILSLGTNGLAKELSTYTNFSDLQVPLINGVKYTVKLQTENANGLSEDDVTYGPTAPLGPISAIQSIALKGAASLDGSNHLVATFTYVDLSGNDATGGHLVDKLHLKVTQQIGTETRLLGTEVIDAAGNYPATKQGQTVDTGALTFTAGTAVFGFAMTVTATPVASAATGYNTTDVSGTPLTSTIGAVLASNDEVQVLTASQTAGTTTTATGGLTLTFSGANQSALTQLTQADKDQLALQGITYVPPALHSYEVRLFDISSGYQGPAGDDPSGYQGSLVGSVQTLLISESVDDIYTATYTGLEHGKTLVPHVVTVYKQGDAANLTISKTTGAYIDTATSVGLPAVDASGFFDLVGSAPADKSIIEVFTAAVPTITLDTSGGSTTALKIDDMGSTITYGAIIQVLPAATADSSSNSFYLDLSGSSFESTSQVFPGSTKRLVHTLSGDLLGTNWDSERNYIFSGNAKGTRVATTGFTSNSSSVQLLG